MEDRKATMGATVAARERKATAAVSKLCFLEYCLREIYEADRHCNFVDRLA
jgi:hypothetical protein